MAIISCKRVTGSPNIKFYDEDNGLSADAFQPGDLVKLNTEGELELATTGVILGIAQKAATGVDNTKIPVDVLYGDEFSAVSASSSNVELNLNAVMDFTFTTGAQTVTTGSSDAVLVDFDDPVGTSGGRVILKIIPAAQQLVDATG